MIIINFIKIRLILNYMEQENQLERKIKGFDWKEWTPIAGLYFVLRNFINGKSSLDGNFEVNVNATYHAAVSVAPILYAISEITEKYLSVSIF